MRKAANGSHHLVRVEIQEAPSGVTPRYVVVANAEGSIEHDNENDDLELALSGIPWHKLEPQDTPAAHEGKGKGKAKGKKPKARKSR